MTNLRWFFSVVALVLALAGAAGTAAQDATPALPATPETGATTPVEWTRFDVTLDLRSDGILHVTERQEVRFHGGPFSSGFADIPLRNVDAVEGVRVEEESADGRVTPYNEVSSAAAGSPSTYAVQADDAQVNVDWWFPPTSDAARTFVLEYDVRGAVRLGTQDGSAYAEIWWTAVDADVTAVGPVRAASATLLLPVAPDPAFVLVSPVGYEPAATGDGAEWTWRREPLPPGEALTVRLRFPADALPTPPATPAVAQGSPPDRAE